MSAATTISTLTPSCHRWMLLRFFFSNCFIFLIILLLVVLIDTNTVRVVSSHRPRYNPIVSTHNSNYDPLNSQSFMKMMKRKSISSVPSLTPPSQDDTASLSSVSSFTSNDLDYDCDEDKEQSYSFDYHQEQEKEDEEEFESRSRSSQDAQDKQQQWQQAILPPHKGYKKVLVTGGAGFIGSHVAQALLQRGDDVVIVDEMNDYYDVTIKESNLASLLDEYGEERVTIYRGDICDENLMRDVFETHGPEWVCHLAARAGVRPSIEDPFVYIHSNIRGTTVLLQLSHEYRVKNFVFASSSSVYGGSKSMYFSEDEAVDHPVSPYAATKKACELLAYTYHHLYKLNVSGLRFFTVYGERGRPDMAPFMFIDRISKGLEIQQFGDGTSSRDYTYISDIVDGVIRSIDRPYPYQIFNLGKGSGTSLKEFIDTVQKYTGKKASIRVLPDQPGDVPYTCADVTKASVLLGYEAKVSFEEGIRRTVQWYNRTFGENSEVFPSQLGEMSGLVDRASLNLGIGVVVGEIGIRS